MSTFITGQDVFRSDGCNVLSAPGTTFAFRPHAQFAGMRFIPQFAYAVLQAMSGGALTVSPGLRIGTNGTHDDVCPIFTVPLATPLNVFAQLPLAAFPLIPVNMRALPVYVEVTQAGVGPSSCTGDIILVGFKVSS